MPRARKYPQWVHDQCPKGHTVKEKDGKYYLYKTTSQYRPGKCPLPKSTYVGRITPEGIIYSSKKRIDMSQRPQWYEYGFSKACYQLAYPVLLRTFENEQKTKEVVLSIIRKYSPRSYLLKGIELPEKMGVCLSNQEQKIEKMAGTSMSELLTLKDILLIETSKKPIITSATPEQEALLERLEVNLDA